MVYFECPACHFELKQKNLIFQSFLHGSIRYHECINPTCSNFQKLYVEESEKVKPNNDFRLRVLMRDRQILEHPLLTNTPPRSCAEFEITAKKPHKKKERVAYDYGVGSSKRRHSHRSPHS